MPAACAVSFNGALLFAFFVLMAGNTFGKVFRLTTFGESHGPAIGGVIDGCPAGLTLDLEAIQKQLDRRRPGQSKITTQRKEKDQVRFLSGIFEGKTLGTPIGFLIENEDRKSRDYDHLKEVFRPSHADNTYQGKYGHRDHRGGGRASARETACRVVAGAIAQQLLGPVRIHAYVSSVGEISMPPKATVDYQEIERNLVRAAHRESAEKFQQLIEKTRKAGDTIGGVISVQVEQVPLGWGAPVFDKLPADLAKAMMSINATKGFEIGSGFQGATMLGSEHNDRPLKEGGFASNYAGGVQGGLSNGNQIYFRVAFKPVATLMQDQKTVDNQGEEVLMKGKGRHDPCVVPRAVAIVEAMTALVLADHYLRSLTDQIEN